MNKVKVLKSCIINNEVQSVGVTLEIDDKSLKILSKLEYVEEVTEEEKVLEIPKEVQPKEEALKKTLNKRVKK